MGAGKITFGRRKGKKVKVGSMVRSRDECGSKDGTAAVEGGFATRRWSRKGWPMTT